MKYPEILAARSGPVEFSYGERDTMLYALGVGAGTDVLDDSELSFVYERGLRALPTMSTILLRGANVVADAGIDFRMMLHGEQRLQCHAPLPPAGRLKVSSRVLSVADKGKEKGALVYVEHTLTDAERDVLYSTLVFTLFCRGDGGFDGPSAEPFPLHAMPARSADKEVSLRTVPNQAALYRISSGDTNPLHIDPKVAAAVGFEKPLLHGLCTYGYACRAVLKAYCDNDPAKLRSFDARFAAPVFPGDTLVTAMWRDGNVVSFECRVAGRNAVVLKNGRCEIAV